MSEKLDRRERDFSKFDSMTTEALQQILRLDAMKPIGEESDTEELFYIMEVLADRRRNDSTFTGKTAQQAFNDFQKYYMPEDAAQESADAVPEVKIKHSVLWLRRLGALAAALAIVFFTTLTADAFGFDLFGKVAKWSAEFFHFEGHEEPTEISDPDMIDQVEYTSLQEALDDYKITQNLAPTWLPDGYALSEIDISENPYEKVVYSRYTGIKDNNEISISIRQILIGSPLNIEKSDNLVEIYDSKGIAYYIVSNHNQVCAAWVVEEFECFIAGSITIDELKKIVDSI